VVVVGLKPAVDAGQGRVFAAAETGISSRALGWLAILLARRLPWRWRWRWRGRVWARVGECGRRGLLVPSQGGLVARLKPTKLFRLSWRCAAGGPGCVLALLRHHGTARSAHSAGRGGHSAGAPGQAALLGETAGRLG